MSTQIKKLNLGCGKDIKPKEEGWINIDYVNFKGVDIIHDLKKLPYPFKENTFDELYSRGTLALLPCLIDNMQEIGRICKNRAKVTIIEGCFPCISSFQDPLVKTIFTYNTMNYFTDMGNNNYTPKGIKFKILKKLSLKY